MPTSSGWSRRCSPCFNIIDAETGAHVCSDQFDADRADLLNMQDEIVTRLAIGLDVEMVAIETAHVAPTRPGNLDAVDFAMRCQVGWNSSTWGSPEYDAAYGFCEQALQIDERNVYALSLLAAVGPTRRESRRVFRI